MQRRHSMPFGAELQDEGRVRFRLWAPGVEAVELCLWRDGAEAALALQAQDEGWYECFAQAPPGSRYSYRLEDGRRVPDPASRRQPEGVHGPSAVVDPTAWDWHDGEWRGRPWEEAVIYELHVGTFTPQGTFTGVQERLDHLVRLGVTAIELMPVAECPGSRNWGYDGVLLFAPEQRYGTPEHLKALVQAAHARGLMVLLDVVYNHFGPEGNYLHAYAPQFFTERHHTPWGAAINFDGPDSRWVRRFFIENALYWLEEYHFDGLRLDAVHAILDDSDPDILVELAEAVQRGPGRERHVHLVLENDANAARYFSRDERGRPRWYVAQWNDDLHHTLHVLATGETGGYYVDVAEQTPRLLGRCLTEGFAYQGEPSPYRAGAPRGEPSAHLPPGAFVSFLQNHDQVGNRAFGERIASLAAPEAVRAMVAIMLLAPSPPLLFMGEEWGATQPFLFFCDFGPDLAAAVTEGRRREFARFPQFSDPAARERIPDPQDRATFLRSVLDWSGREKPEHRPWLDLYRELLALRHREIVPRLGGMQLAAGFERIGEHGLVVHWTLTDGALLTLLANPGGADTPGAWEPRGELLWASDELVRDALAGAGLLPAWSAAWYLDRPQ
jgi:maltooligosyltrehalose trehalohydrolase